MLGFMLQPNLQDRRSHFSGFIGQYRQYSGIEFYNYSGADAYTYYGGGAIASFQRWLGSFAENYANPAHSDLSRDLSIFEERRFSNPRESFAVRLVEAVRRSERTTLMQTPAALARFIEAGEFYANLFSQDWAADTQVITTENSGLSKLFEAVYEAGATGELDTAVAILRKFVDDGGDVVKSVDYSRRLLRSANLVRELKDDMQNVSFLKELVNLGEVYASLDPTAPTTTTEPLRFFLDTLWRQQDGRGQQRGATEMQEILGLSYLLC
jgi:hypothetical protein